MVSRGFTWTHLDSLALTWSYLVSLGFCFFLLGITWGHLYLKGKGKSRRHKMEKGKFAPSIEARFHLTSRADARAHARRTKRNDFPVGLTPPNLRFGKAETGNYLN